MTRFGREELVEVPRHLINLLVRDEWVGRVIVPCSHHVLVQHRDNHPPWCNRCGFDNLGIKYLKEKDPVANDEEKFPTVARAPLNINSDNNLQHRAMAIVASVIESNLEITDATSDFEVYVVWFTKVLQNWKALVSSTLPDGKYYEVTYDGNMSRTYVDCYVKFSNICIKDE